jgi:sulfur carrier protein
MNIILNGETQALTDGATVADLIKTLGYEGKRIAVERNGEIVPKSRHGQTPLADGDALEIVVAVGGG